MSRLEEDGIIFEKVYINSDLVRRVLKFKLIHSRLTYFVKQQEVFFKEQSSLEKELDHLVNSLQLESN